MRPATICACNETDDYSSGEFYSACFAVRLFIYEFASFAHGLSFDHLHVRRDVALKKFLKEHAYETVLAVLIVISGGSILAFYQSVEEAVSAYPLQITAMAVLAALVGAFLWSLLDRREALIEREKQKGETDRQRMELENSIAAENDAAEGLFRSMSFRAKGLCYKPAIDGVRDISGEEDIRMNFDDPDWKEAEGAGFIIIEPCGKHQHRIRATKKLLSLVEANPKLLDELEHDMMEDFSRNYVLQQTMGEDGRMTPLRVIDKFTGEEDGRWALGGALRSKNAT